jgi:TRAP-type mannitol/chloroaromatic compound transport system substrate-binding protein
MKRVLFLLAAMAAIAALVLVGCAPEAAAPVEEEEEEAPAAPEEEEEEAPAAPEEEVITWKVQDSYDAANPAHVAAERICDAVTEASGGCLVFKSFTGGSIVPATKEAVHGVDKGVIQATYTCPMYSLDTWAAAGLFSARPGQMTSHPYMTWYNWAGGVDLINKMMEGYDLYALRGCAPRPAEVWCLSTIPIEGLDDIRGLRIRTAGDGGEVLTRMGASVVFMPGGELYEATQRGVIDAFEYSTPAVNWPMAFHEVAKYHYFSATRAPSDPLSFIVARSAWEELPDDLKQLVEAVVMSGTTRHDMEEYQDSIEAIPKHKEYGCVLEHLPEEIEVEMLKVTEEFYDEKAAKEDPIYSEILTSMREFKKAYGEYNALNTPYAI